MPFWQRNSCGVRFESVAEAPNCECVSSLEGFNCQDASVQTSVDSAYKTSQQCISWRSHFWQQGQHCLGWWLVWMQETDQEFCRRGRELGELKIICIMQSPSIGEAMAMQRQARAVQTFWWRFWEKLWNHHPIFSCDKLRQVVNRIVILLLS